MSIEQLSHPLTTTNMTGGTTTPRDEIEKRNEQFAQYLMAIKGAKLSETQLQKLGETKAIDDRTRTIEKTNERKVQSDDEQYRKMRSNGYTVGETRRGVDQIDKALERKSQDSQRDAAHQKTDAAKDSQQTLFVEYGNRTAAQNTAQHGTLGQNVGELPSVSGMMSNDATANSVGQNTLDANAVSLQALDAANAMTQQAGDNIASHVDNGLRANGTSNPTRNLAERIAINVSEQQSNHHATASGKIAASLVAAMTGMMPVTRSGNTRLDAELDAKFSATVGLANASKANAKDNVTQEALTAASETQQAANDPGQSQPNNGVPQAAKDVAASQTLPSTSLIERLDQARLVNRVTGAFRSLANQSGTIRMKLHPEELGALTIRMQIEAGKVTAKLEAETETAKQVLLDNIDTLKKKLKEQNLEVAAFDIEVTLPEAKNGQQTTQTQQSDRAIANKNKGYTEPEHVDFYS